MKIVISTGLAVAAAVIASAGLTAGSATATAAPAATMTATGATAAKAAPMAARSLSPQYDVLAAVACETARDCLAVGYNDGAANGESPPLAATWNGKAWRLAGVKLPAGAVTGSLDAVSCPPAAGAPCMVTGDLTPKKWAASGGWAGLADLWNGTRWTPTPVNGTKGVELTSVSCPAAHYCLAVGTYTQPVGYASKGIAYRWNGSRWARADPPVPPGGDSELDTVSCSSATFCVAVGSSGSKVIAYRWNGKRWAAMKAVTLKGFPVPSPIDVSCGSPKSCLAVDAGPQLPASGMVERWNGKVWTASVPAAFQSTLETGATMGVSCASADYCVAISDELWDFFPGDDPGDQAAAWVWNGRKWSADTVQFNPDEQDDFYGVSCLRATFCTAVGSYESMTSTSAGALGGFWNGHGWRLKAAP